MRGYANRLSAAGLAAICAALSLPIAGASARENPCPAGKTEQQCLQDTLLISRNYAGDVPNGSSGNADIAHDGAPYNGKVGSRWSSVVAFESDASDLLAPNGDTNGKRDVYAVIRNGTPPRWRGTPDWQARRQDDGAPWEIGRTLLVSRGLGGQPANGASYNPAVSGEFPTPARCIGFISGASNLVRGDTNGVADAFVYWLATGAIERVSVGSQELGVNNRPTRGKAQANGPSFDIDVDGDCTRVAFTSSATNLHMTRPGVKYRYLGSRGRKRAIAFPNVERVPYVVAGRAPAGVKQVYMRQLFGCQESDRTRGCDEEELAGMTALMSAGDRRQAGNLDSEDPSFAYRMNRTHQKLAFESKATNLQSAGGGGNNGPVSDVFVRDFTPIGRNNRVKQAHDTVLVSQRENGQPGNGPSTNPSFSEEALYVSYQTDATNIYERDTGGKYTNDAPRPRSDVNGVTDVVRASLCANPNGDVCPNKLAVPRQHVISSDNGGLGRGASRNPSVSNGGSYTAFESDAENFKGLPGGRKLVPDVFAADNTTIAKTLGLQGPVSDIFLLTFERGIDLLQSRTSRTDYEALLLPSSRPSISARGNYIVYETAEPLADLNWAAAKHPEWLPRRQDPVAFAKQTQVRLEAQRRGVKLLYMRYLGGEKFEVERQRP